MKYKEKLLRSFVFNAPLPPASPQSPLFGVPFPAREKLRLKLEKIYYELLLKEYDKAIEQRTKDAIKRLTSGIYIDDLQLTNIQLELFQDEINQECYEISAQRSAAAARAGAEMAAENINGTLEKEQKAALRSADKSEYNSILAEFQGQRIVLEEFGQWLNMPSVQRIVGGNANRETDFYSEIFFRTNQNEELLTVIKENIRKGKGVEEVVNAAQTAMNKTGETAGHLKNVVRTETTRAMEEGRRETALRSKYCKAFKFFAAHDYRTTIYCAERHLCLIDVEDETNLQRCTPPLHYQCRSTLAELSRRQLENAGGYEQIEADKLKLDNAPNFQWS